MTQEQYIAKQELLNYSKLQRNLKDLTDKLETLEERITKTTSATDKIIVQGGDADKTDLISQYIELKQLYEKENAYAVRKMLQIEHNIQGMCDVTEQRILRNKYIFAKTFEEIAVFESICWRHIMRLHKKALKNYYENNLKDRR